MSTRQAKVSVAYATVKLLDPATGKWTVRGFHEGAIFPAEADPDNVANLVRRGYAQWVDDEPAEPAEADTGDEVEAAAVESDVEANVERPAQSASKADWVAYAVAQRAEGVSEEDATAEAEAMTKADLIAIYGG